MTTILVPVALLALILGAQQRPGQAQRADKKQRNRVTAIDVSKLGQGQAALAVVNQSTCKIPNSDGTITQRTVDLSRLKIVADISPGPGPQFEAW